MIQFARDSSGNILIHKQFRIIIVIYAKGVFRLTKESFREPHL